MGKDEALKRIAEKLRRSGASVPAPQVTGTIEGCIVTGLCIALALVESEIEALEQPAPANWVRDEKTIWVHGDSTWDEVIGMAEAKLKEKNT